MNQTSKQLLTLILCGVCLCGAVNNSAATCKWTDKNGTLHFSDDKSSAPKGTKCEEDLEDLQTPDFDDTEDKEDLSLCKSGWSATEAGDHAKAVTLFEKCIKTGRLSGKSLARTYRNIGIAYRRNENPLKSIEYFNKAVSMHPADIYNDYVNRGNAWSDLGEFNAALKDYDHALSIKQDYNEAYYNRGIVFERQDQFELAKKEFIKAYEYGLRSDYLYDRFVKYGLVDK